MVDLQYGAVLRPEWSSEIVRQEHPTDGASVYTVHEAVADSLPKDRYSPEPLMLLHGVGNSGAIYGPMLGSFAELGPVMAPTMSPELLSTGSELRQDAVSQLVEWLAELSPPPWRLVGHSMGGILTGLILRTHPEVASSAVLLNSPLPGTIERLRTGDSLDRNGRALLALKGLARITSFGRPRLPRFLRGTELAIVRAGLGGFVANPGALDARVISRAIVRSRTTDGIDFLRMAREMPVWEAEPFAACPVEIIQGDDDPLVPLSDHDAVIDSYPAADVHIISDCGHFAHLEQPGLTLDLMSKFYATEAAA
jgi:pimeloyl-ACP methyl ester carboxylesterase